MKGKIRTKDVAQEENKNGDVVIRHMNTNHLLVRVVCGCVASVFVCVCLVYLPPPPFPQMTPVQMFNDDTSIFSSVPLFVPPPLFLISDYVQLFQRLPKVVYSLTSYSRCVVVL
jgi:hypothetical protein